MWCATGVPLVPLDPVAYTRGHVPEAHQPIQQRVFRLQGYYKSVLAISSHSSIPVQVAAKVTGALPR